MAAPRLLLKGRLDTEIWSWAALDLAGNAVSTGSGGVLQAAVAATGRQVLWLVESEDLTLFERPLAVRGRKQLEKAVPYTLEDDLAEDLDQLHIAFTSDGESVRAAAVRRNLLQQGLEALGQAGIRPSRAIPDVLAVPLTAGRWALLIDDERALLRTGPGSGLACTRDLLSPLLVSALAEADEDARPQALQVWRPDREVKLPELPLPIEALPCRGVWPVLASGLADDETPDLLQGEFSAREQRARQLRRWWPVAAALLVWAGLALTNLALQAHRLEQQRASLDAGIERVFRETFPEIHRVENPRVQMEQGLKALRAERAGSQGFLAMLADAAGPLHAQSSVTVKGIEFRNEILELNVEVGDVQQLDALRQALEASTGLQAEIQSVNVEGNRVSGHLRIREAKG